MGTAAVGAVTAAAAKMGTAFVKGVSDVAEYGDNIDKMSQKMGLSAQAYQEWDFIMQHSGTSMESLKASMKTLANAVDKGDDAFQRLGISQQEIKSLNQEQLFARTIEQLQKVNNETERTYLAGRLLGKGATELGALLNTSAEDTEAMRKQVHELGGVMSNEAVKAAAAYQDSLQNMQTAFSGIQRGMLSEFLPSMVTVMDGLTLIFSGNDSGIAKVAEGVNQFADKLMQSVPKIFELGEGIISSLATAILDNLPTLTTTATKVILQLVEGIVSALPQIAVGAIEIIKSLTEGISNSLPTIMNSAIELVNVLANGILEMLPQIIELGLQLLVSLATGIAENLDTIIPTVIDVILKIVETLTNPDTLSQLLMAGLTLIVELAMGLANNMDKIVEAVFTIIENMVSFLNDPANLYMLVETAVKLVLAIGKGLIQAIPQLLSSVWELIKNIFAAFGNIDWGELGRNLIEGLKSITKMWPKLLSSLWELIKKIFTAFKEIDWGELGRNILDGLKNGISKMWQNLKQWFKNLFGDLIGVAKKILGIASPSKVFKQFGLFIDKGLQGGLELGARDVLKTVEGLSNDVANSFNPDLTADYVVGYNRSGSSNSSGGLNAYNTATQKVEVDISIDDSISPLSFARYLLPYLKVAQKEAFA